MLCDHSAECINYICEILAPQILSSVTTACLPVENNGEIDAEAADLLERNGCLFCSLENRDGL